MSNGSALTFDEWLDFGRRHNMDDSRIYDFLTGTIDQAAVDQRIAEIDEIDARPNPGGFSKKGWEGEQNRLKGAAFEALGGLVLQTVRPFHAWNNIQTTINEIDWLIELGPLALNLPTMREWGTHCVCECKIGNQVVNVTWIGKLNTLMQTSGVSVGLLLSRRGIGRKGRAAAARVQLQILAAMTPSRVIVCVDLEEMKLSLEKRQFLQLIARRYIEVKAGAAPLKAIA
jgi:hypothetical protein